MSRPSLILGLHDVDPLLALEVGNALHAEYRFLGPLALTTSRELIALEADAIEDHLHNRLLAFINGYLARAKRPATEGAAP